MSVGDGVGASISNGVSVGDCVGLSVGNGSGLGVGGGSKVGVAVAVTIAVGAGRDCLMTRKSASIQPLSWIIPGFSILTQSP